jgi:hypothetical protein
MAYPKVGQAILLLRCFDDAILLEVEKIAVKIS